MLLRSLVLALTLFIITLSSAASALVAEELIDWKKNGKWAALADYIGTYDVESFWKDSRVKDTLKDMLKGQDINVKDEFAVRGPIGFENDCLILRGNQEGKGDTNRAYMEVCISQGNINLAVYNEGKITLFSKLGDYQYTSEGLKRWVYLQSVPLTDIEKKPADLQIVTQAE